MLHPDLTIVAASDAYLRATLTERDAIVGRGLFDVFPDNPDDPGATGEANLSASLARVRVTLLPDRMPVQQYDIRRPDGSFEVRWWSPLNSPVLDDAGRLEAIIHQVEDVTDRVDLELQAQEERRRQDELRAQAARMEAEIRQRSEEVTTASRQLKRVSAEMERFFALSSDLFGVFALDGRFRRVNPAWQQVMGYRPDELVGRPFIDLVHPEDVGPTIAEFARATAEGTTTTHFINRYRHADGTYHWLEWTGRLAPGEGVHYSAARDISRRKVTEQALESARVEAERANLAKSEFLSRMSHELRTPLNAILGFAQLLEAEVLPPDQQECVTHITRAGRHLVEMINEILDISRIESGRMTISPEPVAVGELLEDVTGIILPLADRRSVLLQVDDPCGAHVLADRQRLRQVLVNLLGNAVKYGRDGGAVRVTCEPVGQARLRISVIDTGPGIAPEHAGRIFQPFERLGAETSAIEGTGMGLALSKGFVEAMGGTIGVRSSPGEGSTFWLELAVTEAPLETDEATEAAETVARTVASPRTVLLVEDNIANRRLVERVLARRPEIELLTVATGEAGIEVARERRPDLILLDLHLPDTSGLDVLRELRAADVTAGIPVVVVSADATRSQVTRLLESGAAGYLTKPLDVSAFLGLVDRLLTDVPGVVR